LTSHADQETNNCETNFVNLINENVASRINSCKKKHGKVASSVPLLLDPFF